MRVAEDFQLDQFMAIQQLACQTQRAHGIVCSVTAGGVGQVGELFGRHEIQQ
ncbi:hypothetical protein GALL_379960 [mine drainage metagenome]|uniref:Uncharacterized protein n=1 Tax=mine drainage metagenome TaxID=410659 RepID=A0A1J5QRY8_9ZZZZ